MQNLASAITITVTPDEDSYVLTSSTADVEYECRTDVGVVLWQVYDYQLIDQDLFRGDGVLIDPPYQAEGVSTLRLTQNGRKYLLNKFALRGRFTEKQRCEAKVIELWCFVPYDSVRIELGPHRRIVINGEFHHNYFIHVTLLVLDSCTLSAGFMSDLDVFCY